MKLERDENIIIDEQPPIIIEMDRPTLTFKPLNLSQNGNPFKIGLSNSAGKKFSNGTRTENRLNTVMHSTAPDQPGKITKRKQEKKINSTALIQVKNATR